MISASIVVSLDGRIGKPNSIEHGGWTSSEDKAKFWKLVKQSQLSIVGANTWNGFSASTKTRLVANSRVLLYSGRNSTHSEDLLKHALSCSVDEEVLILGGAKTFYFFRHVIHCWNITTEPVLLASGPSLFPLLADDKNRIPVFLQIERLKQLNAEGTIHAVYTKR